MLFRKKCGIDLGSDTIKIADKKNKKVVFATKNTKNCLKFSLCHYTIRIGRNWIYGADVCRYVGCLSSKY